MNASDDELEQYLNELNDIIPSRDCGPVDNPMQLPRSIHQ